MDETLQMLNVYTDFAVNEAAIPVIPGDKSDAEKFAGADVTYSIEAMMGDGKALQSGTSHFLGQNFAQAFEVKYLDQNGPLQHCWTTSWGLSTRMIGAIIMVHGDDQGLVLPPASPPSKSSSCPSTKPTKKKPASCDSRQEFESAAGQSQPPRDHLDEREGFSPGWKFNDWEMRGVPVRVELGPKDVAKQAAVLARRDRPGREGKVSAPLADLPATIEKLLGGNSQVACYDKALAFRRANTRDTTTYDDLKKAVEERFCLFPLVRQRRLRSQNQRGNPRHHALHPNRSARRSRHLRLLRQARLRARHLRPRLLTRIFSTPRDAGQRTPRSFPGTSLAAASRHSPDRMLVWDDIAVHSFFIGQDDNRRPGQRRERLWFMYITPHFGAIEVPLSARNAVTARSRRFCGPRSWSTAHS